MGIISTTGNIIKTAGNILDKTYRYSGLKLATKATSAILGAGSESFGNISKKEAAFGDFIKSSFSAEKKKESPSPTPPGPGGGGIDPETKNNIKKIESNTSTILRTTDDIKFSVEGMKGMMEKLTNIAEMQLKAMERMIDEIKKMGSGKDKEGFVGKMIFALGALWTAFTSGLENVRKKMLGGLESLQGAGKKVWDKIGDGLKALGGVGKKVWDKIGDGLKALRGVGKKVWDKIGDGLSSIKKSGSKVFDSLTDGIKKFGKSGKEGFEKLVEFLGKGLKKVIKRIPVIGALVAGAEGVSDALDASKEYEQGKITERERNSKYGAAAGGVGGTMAGAAAGAAVGSVVPVVGTVIGGVVGGALGYWGGQKAGGAVGGLVGEDVQPDSSDTESESFFGDMFGGLEESLSERLDKSLDWYKEIKETLSKSFKELPDDFAKAFKTMTDAAKYAAVGTYRQMTASPETISKNQAFVEGLRDKDPYMYALAMKESSGGSNLFAKTSSATGSWQFTDATWQDTVKEMGKEYSLEDRLDPEKAYEVAKFFDTKNRSHLQKELGREVSSKDAYMAHFLGRGGATSFLKNYDPNDPNQKGTDLVGAEQAAANKSIFYNEDGSSKTSKEVYASLTNKFSGAEQDYSMVASATKSAPTKTEVVAQQNAMAKNEAASRPVVVSVPSPPQPAPVQPAPSTSVVNNYVSNGGDPMIRLISAESSMARLGVSYGFA